MTTSSSDNVFSNRSSSGEYCNNPLSPPSVGLEPPNISSPKSETSRDSSRFDRTRLNSVASVGDTDFAISPKPPIGITKQEHSPIASTSSGRDGSPSNKSLLPTGRKRTSSTTNAAGDKRTATKVCRVCGDKAYSYNFNVITCESCKAFFRRNANKEKEIRCPFNDQCDINVVSRRFCQRCRLQKCFNVGMKKEWIMSEEARLEKKQRVQDNRERRLAAAAAVVVTNPNTPTPQSSAENLSRRSSEEKNDQFSPILKTTPLMKRRTAKLETSPNNDVADPIVEQSSIQQRTNTSSTPGSCQPQPSPANMHSPSSQIFAPCIPVLSNNSVTLPPTPGILEVAGANPLETLPSPMITAAGFRPPILSDPLPSNNITISPASIVQSPSSFISSQQQQHFVNHVAQQVQLAQAHIQQAQLEHQLQQQAAAQLVQQQATAQHIVQQQLAAVQQHQQQLAAAVVAAANTTIPVVSPTPSSIKSSIPTIGPISGSSKLPSLALSNQQLNSHIQTVTEPTITNNHPSTSKTDADMVTIPRNVLLQLVGQTPNINAPGNTLQMGVVPQKCACTCVCGRYRQNKPIVDEVMTEFLANSRANEERNEIKNDAIKVTAQRYDEVVPSGRSGVQWLHSNNPVNIGRDLIARDEIETKIPRGSLFKNASLLEEELESVKVDPDCCLMTSADQDRLNELIGANAVWSELEPNSVDEVLHQQGRPSKIDMVNMADGAIRRMIRMTKRIETFRRIEHHDQIQLLKSSCMEYIILRGAMSYDPIQNAWKGPNPTSGYSVKMDAMKDTQDNMFENSIRFYATFKEEWRTNESVMLLLGMIVIFNPEFPNLHNRVAVEEENRQYKRVLKRLLFSLCNQDPKRTNKEMKGLLDQINYLKPLNIRAQRMLQEVDSSSMEPLLLEMFAH